jgi:hypothetical protein
MPLKKPLHFCSWCGKYLISLFSARTFLYNNLFSASTYGGNGIKSFILASCKTPFSPFDTSGRTVNRHMNATWYKVLVPWSSEMEVQFGAVEPGDRRWDAMPGEVSEDRMQPQGVACCG